ncbi:hypothetical protein NP233_g9902 [Leucocoprinus birnbaumii]|uniref:Uncharacterized protein n=1 Tax=Leucocoprinus birnbaumii TaxID=56174 RepID=A0AAD5VLX3_9AGAR|nr:hypothetical protein NP233_g9902 [Leucocoprinus birnbaumii]
MERGFSVDIEPEFEIPDDVDRTHQLCETCEVYVPHERCETHPTHKLQKQLDRYVHYKIAPVGPVSLEMNSVVILGNLEFDVIPPETSGQGITRTIEVRATEALAMFGDYSTGFSSPFSFEIGDDNRRLFTTRPIKIVVTLQETCEGLYKDALELRFEDTRRNIRITIALMASGIVALSNSN